MPSDYTTNKKKIVLTGGGTAGHVTPNIALFPGLRERGYDISYIGSYDGIEKKLIEEFNVPYYGVSTGKLRRYLTIENLKEPYRILKGCQEAKKILAGIKPDVIFSKGGFVSVPVLRAAKTLKIPAIIHESDMTPGLANRLSIPWADKVCYNFPETADHLPKDKGVLTGTPLRKELLTGDKITALNFTGLSANKPVIMVIGGSLGSAAINQAVRNILPELLKDFQVVHLCGKGKLDESLMNTPGYVQYEYIKKELADLFALSSLVISRAGANAICELLALKKPNILIPLPKAQSRGDQILNAASFEKQGFSAVLTEETWTEETLLTTIRSVYKKREQYITTMTNAQTIPSITRILELIDEAVSEKK